MALIGQRPIALEHLVERVVAEAVDDAGLSLPLLDCAVVVGSSRGNQAEWETLTRQMKTWNDAPICQGKEEQNAQSALHSFPTLSRWLDTLPHAAAIATARQIGTQASVRSPMAACATGLWAIAQAVDLIQTGQYERVLAGAIEAPITPLSLTGFDQMGALARTGAYPFDRDREGLVLAEAGAVLVLESAELAHQRSAPIYGRVLGAGFTADGYHITTPAPGGRAAIAAVKQCLNRSGLVPAAIDYIHAHGTATQLNDRNEAILVQSLFPSTVSISSTKGATGHAIGASGALGIAFCLLALRDQRLPPCVGLRQPESTLNFVRTTCPYPVVNALCLSFGFGGQNAAIAVSAHDANSSLSPHLHP
jgi:3-oxoacyl-[acyl-carrier-protein] synthase II